jgi:hypothetical protein
MVTESSYPPALSCLWTDDSGTITWKRHSYDERALLYLPAMIEKSEKEEMLVFACFGIPNGTAKSELLHEHWIVSLPASVMQWEEPIFSTDRSSSTIRIRNQRVHLFTSFVHCVHSSLAIRDLSMFVNKLPVVDNPGADVQLVWRDTVHHWIAQTIAHVPQNEVYSPNSDCGVAQSV